MAIIQILLKNKAFNGTNSNDLIFGTLGNDIISAGGGSDIVYSFAGNDTVNGGLGNDLIFAGAGNDILHGNEGTDIIYGEGGIDLLYGDAGNDYLNSGSDADMLLGGQGNDILDGEGGIDTAVFSGKSNEYSIRYNPDGSVTVIDLKANRDGIDLLYNMEFIKFSNTNIAIKANTAPNTLDVSATGAEDSAVIPIILKGTDDGSIASFSLSSLPSNGRLYTDAAHTHEVTLSTNYSAVGNELTLYFVPNANFNGDVSFNYAAKDNLGAVDTTPASAIIHVTAVNDAPIVQNSIPDLSTNEDSLFSYTVPNNTFSDVDDTHLRLSATLQDGSALPSWLHFSNSTFTGTPDDPDVGSINIKLTAEDSTYSVSDVFTLTVNPVNDAPFIVLSDYTFVEDVFSSIQFNNFGDAEGDPITFTASLSNGDPLPSWLRFDTSNILDGPVFSGKPTNDDVGTLSIKVVATDNHGSSSTSTFNLTIQNVNDAPTLANPIADKAADEDSFFTFTVPSNTFNDVDNPHLTLTATLEDGSDLPSWLHFSGKTFSGTPDDPDAGSFNIKVTATDGSASISDVFTLTVNPVNDPPTLATPIADQTTNEDSLFSFTIPANTFSDVDDTHLRLSATLEDGSALPSWLSFSGKTFSGTPDDPDVGSINIKVTAEDADYLVSDVFTLTVNPVNDAPVLVTPIADKVTNEDSFFIFTVPSSTFSDEDDIHLTLSATLENDSALPSWLSFNGKTFSGTPDDPDVGSINIKVTATDGSASISDLFTLTVNPVNDPPTLATPIADQTTNEDSLFSFTIPADTFSDVDDTHLRLSATLEDGSALPSWLSFSGKTFTGTPDDPDVGSINIKVTAEDADYSVSDVFTLTVNPVNDAPFVVLSDYTFVEDAFNSIQFNDYGDAEGDPITFTASLSNGDPLPSWLTFDPGNILGGGPAFLGTPTNDDVGTLSIKVVATDNHGDSSTSTFNLTIQNVNDAPTLATPIADQTTNEDSLFSFTVPANTFSDVDDLHLRLSATLEDGSALPSWLSFSGKTFTGTPDDPDVGSINIKVTAEDGTYSVSDVFTLTVNPVNDAPRLVNPLSDRLVDEDAAFSFPGNTGFFDEDGDVLTYTATQEDGTALPSWIQFDGTTFSGFSSVPVDPVNILLTATDPSGASGQDLFTVRVNPVNDAPHLFTPIGDHTVTQNVAFSFRGDTGFFDEDGDLLTYTATQQDGSPLPSWIQFDGTTFSGLATTFSSVTILLTAQDPSGATGIDLFTVRADPAALFTSGNDTVDFNSVIAGSYLDGTQYNALEGDDNVILPTNNSEAQEASYDSAATFSGGAGNDIITSGTLVDHIGGNDGDDTFIVGALNAADDFGHISADTYDGGTGKNTLDLSLLPAVTSVAVNLTPSGFNHTEKLVINGLSNSPDATLQNIQNVIGSISNDTITTNSEVNNVMGNAGDDIFIVGALNTAGADTYDGGAGSNTLDLSSLSGVTSVAVNLIPSGYNHTEKLVIDSSSNSPQATFQNIQNVIGSEGNETITTNNEVNNIVSNGGDDTVTVGALNTDFGSGINPDSYDGGNGIDTLDLSLLNEAAQVVYNQSGVDLTTVANPSTIYASVINFETIMGTQYDDRFITNDQVNIIFGNDGDDIFQVKELNPSTIGPDTYTGGAGHNYIDLSLLTADTIISLKEAGYDTPHINANDTTINFHNISTIVGSAGADIFLIYEHPYELLGGDGDDIFKVMQTDLSNIDRLDGGNGINTLDISNLDINSAYTVDLSRGFLSVNSNGNDATQSEFIDIQNIIGSAGDDLLIGDNLDNIIQSGAASRTDYIDGQDGVDISVQIGPKDNYTYISNPDNSIYVIDNVGNDGADLLNNIEFIKFDDRTIDVKDLILDGQEHPF